MKRKLSVLVLMGGASPEHEVSLISGQEVVRNLNPDKYKVTFLVIPKSGKLPKIPGGVDLVFLAMHGPNGEDGKIQAWLELQGINYTGSGVLASALSMNKTKFCQYMQSFRIPCPNYVQLTDSRLINFEKIGKELGSLPYFVKPNDQGSSVGCSLVTKKTDLGKAVKEALKYSKIALVDKYYSGREITCGVLGNEKAGALPLIEIITKRKFFDYQAKYVSTDTQEIPLTGVKKSLYKKIQELAVNIHQGVGARGFSRVDFILSGENIVVLEINTIPGLTPRSLLPKAAKLSGMSYSDLLDTIIMYARK